MPATAHALPRDDRFDATAALLADPYRYIGRRARELRSDAFETRLGLERTICLTGAAAARLFYDPSLFRRRGAAPEPLRSTLFGNDGVQTLDGIAHAHRKRWFLDLLGPGTGSVVRLAEGFVGELGAAAAHWERLQRIALYPAVQPVLARAVCRWAGVPLARTEVAKRTRGLASLFDEAAAVGRGHVRARLSRGAAEAWLAGLVEAVRSGDLRVARGTALQSIATFRDERGECLAPRVAAVELLNVLRPTVAISVYVACVAHALQAHPEARMRIADGEPGYLAAFVQEVRRYYPFFPAVAARVRRDFEWRGLRFATGTRAMLDLYGTNHDPRAWAVPHAFRPERFRGREADPYEFVPQGGGLHGGGHRCPGEWITVALTKVAAEFLATRLRYALPPQDLALDWSRLPSLPKSGVVMDVVRVRARHESWSPHERIAVGYPVERPSHSA